MRGKRYSPISCPIHNYCQGGSTWCLQNSRPQRCGSDHNHKCHLALSPESTPLPWKCVAASIPIPGSLREWQECHGDVNGDIRSHSRQRTTAQGGRGCQLLGAGGGGGDMEGAVFLLWFIDVCSQVHTYCLDIPVRVRMSVCESVCESMPLLSATSDIQILQTPTRHP